MGHHIAWRWGVAFFLAAAVWGCGQSQPPAARPVSEANPAKPAKADSQVFHAIAEAKLPAPADNVANTQTARSDNDPDSAEPAPLPASAAPAPFNDAEAAQLTMPAVRLTQGHADKCRLLVSDNLPDFQLPDLDGQPQSLAKLLGAKATVVVFWNAASATSLEELADLYPDVAKKFSANGVVVVGINTRDDPQLARELVKQAGAQFTNLTDRDGAARKQVADHKPPLTYVVDATGRIRWFDLEYSPSTRRELGQAIRYLLTHD